MTPDPSTDVMVYQVTMVDALSPASLGDRWTVWVGAESEGSFDSESDAIVAALMLAADHQRPAWLVKESGETIAL
jgi:hypothetical protein